MKAAAQTAYFAPASSLTLAPAWRLKAAKPQTPDAASAERYSNRALLAASGEREDRYTGSLEIVSQTALVLGLLYAMGQCALQFVQF